MKNDLKDIIKVAKHKAELYQRNAKDWRYQKVIGYLVAKKLLFAEGIKLRPMVKLWSAEIIWAAENVEPRIWEVIPAVLLNYPRTIIDPEKLPPELHVMVKAIQNNSEFQGVFRNIDYRKVVAAAAIKPNNQRIKSFRERKVMRSYRFTPEFLKRLAAKAKSLGCSETQALEDLLLEK